MTSSTRRIVIDADFETTIGAVSRALRDEGLDVLARIDVRDHFWRNGHDFRRYFLVETWSPDAAFQALRSTLDAGATLTTTLAVYELADGETAVVTREPDQESDRMRRVLARLTTSCTPAATVSTA